MGVNPRRPIRPDGGTGRQRPTGRKKRPLRQGRRSPGTSVPGIRGKPRVRQNPHTQHKQHTQKNPPLGGRDVLEPTGSTYGLRVGATSTDVLGEAVRVYGATPDPGDTLLVGGVGDGQVI